MRKRRGLITRLMPGWMMRVLIVMTLVTTLGLSTNDFSGNSSAYANADSALVERLLHETNELVFENDSLRIVIWQKDQKAINDSTFSAEMLSLYKEDRGVWLIRFFKKPEVMLITGAIIGAYVRGR